VFRERERYIYIEENVSEELTGIGKRLSPLPPYVVTVVDTLKTLCIKKR